MHRICTRLPSNYLISTNSLSNPSSGRRKSGGLTYCSQSDLSFLSVQSSLVRWSVYLHFNGEVRSLDYLHLFSADLHFPHDRRQACGPGPVLGRRIGYPAYAHRNARKNGTLEQPKHQVTAPRHKRHLDLAQASGSNRALNDRRSFAKPASAI